MKSLIFLLSMMLVFEVQGQTNTQHVKVNGYTKSNGTYVAPHIRTAPNSTNRDNFTTKPNTNPYTGESGYIQPDGNSINPYATPSPKPSYYESSQNNNQDNYSDNWRERQKEYDNYRFPDNIVRKRDGMKCKLINESSMSGTYEYQSKTSWGTFTITKYEVENQIRFYSNLPPVYNKPAEYFKDTKITNNPYAGTGLEDVYEKDAQQRKEYEKYKFPDLIIRKRDKMKCVLVDENDMSGTYEYQSQYSSGTFTITKYDVENQIRFYSNLPPVYGDNDTKYNIEPETDENNLEEDSDKIFLNYLGYSKTKESIKKFQREHGLIADGIIGSITHQTLVKVVQAKLNK